MNINELKKKNYFRFLQLSSLKLENKDEIALIFLLESELFKIFYSTEEIILRKIRYQWLKDEFNNKNTKFKLLIELVQLDKKYDIKDDFNKILSLFQIIDNKIHFLEDCVNFFESFNFLFRKLIGKVALISDFSNKTSFLFQLSYFFYLNRTNNLYSHDIFFKLYTKKLKKDYDLFEKIFIESYIKNLKSGQKKIKKLNFIFNLILGMVSK